MIDTMPTKRSCPSVSSTSLRKLSRHSCGAAKGSRPSTTSTSANAVSSESPTRFPGAADVARRAGWRYFGAFAPGAAPPEFFQYLKNSEVGSSTITSFLPLKVALYASRLR